ncbi:MAG TPA: molybdopterin-binding protein [Anaeromyxobacteraceae bacterium]|nr:molybdopterin-binding protein [Anaeromyxobacteraceae bacterium]
MPVEADRNRPPPCEDVRLRGFFDRAPLGEALAWLDACAPELPAEDIGVADASGRVLASAIEAPADFPAVDRAGENGYAVRAGDTVGAGAYNPLPFALHDGSTTLPAAAAVLIAAGDPLPPGANAVLPFEATQATGDASLEVLAALAEGAGVERAGQHFRGGALLVGPGRVLRPQDLGLLALLRIERIRAIRRPRVRLVVADPPPLHHLCDANGPVLRALIERDGGTVESVASGAELRVAIARAAEGADVVLVAGRTSTGRDDLAPLSLAAIGELAIHGVALRPGGSSGMGLVGDTPVLLLPGDPLACLCAYEILAGRLIRRLGGRDPGLPHAIREAEVRRKMVSMVGLVELCRVRFIDGGAEPMGSAEFGGLASAVRADGFVLIPPPLEGYAPGTRVSVYVY